MWLEFVLVIVPAPRVFPAVFLKPTLLNSNTIGNIEMHAYPGQPNLTIVLS